MHKLSFETEFYLHELKVEHLTPFDVEAGGNWKGPSVSPLTQGHNTFVNIIIFIITSYSYH